MCRWRTALIIRELEDEIAALAGGRELRQQLKGLLRKKELVGDLLNQLRLQHTRHAFGREPAAVHFASADAVRTDLAQLLTVMDRLDQAISPLVRQDGARFSERWGYLSIAGVNDKSQIQRQIEKCALRAAPPCGDAPWRAAAARALRYRHGPVGVRARGGGHVRTADVAALAAAVTLSCSCRYADIYTSRVSNFLRYTPYWYAGYLAVPRVVSCRRVFRRSRVDTSAMCLR